MNGEDFCRVLLERSSRPLRPTRPALARFARSFACSPAWVQTPQPLTENPYDDTMSGVPTTEKCLLPRVVMRCPLLRVREGFPYRRRERRGGAATGRSGCAEAAQPLAEYHQSGNAVVSSHRSLAHTNRRCNP